MRLRIDINEDLSFSLYIYCPICGHLLETPGQEIVNFPTWVHCSNCDINMTYRAEM